MSTQTKTGVGKITSCLLLLFLLTPLVSASGLTVENGLTPLPIFIIFAVIGIGFVVAGLITRNSWLVFIGLGVTFILGNILEQGQLGLGSTTNTTINGSTITSTTSYTAFSGANTHLIGLFVMVFSVISFFLVIFDGGLSQE